MIRRMRVTARWLVFGTAIMSVVGCHQASVADPGLRVGGNLEPTVVSASNVAGGQPVSFGSIILCLGAPGSATVRDVALVDSDARLHLDKFGVRPNPYVRQQQGVGAERSSLAALGFSPSTAQVVETQCPTPGAEGMWAGGSELAIQVSYDGVSTARSRSLQVRYEYGAGTTGTLSIPYGVQLCPAKCADPAASPTSK